MLAIFDFAVDLVEWNMREVQRKAITAIHHAEENRGESAAVKNRERVAIEMTALSLKLEIDSEKER